MSHTLGNRDYWNTMAGDYVEPARRNWAAEDAPLEDRLVRDQFGLFRLTWADGSTEFHLRARKRHGALDNGRG